MFIMNFCILIDEWNNCLERIKFKPKDEDSLKLRVDEIAPWASYRGQTLTRTGKVTNSFVLHELHLTLSNSPVFTVLVRGMMYYRRALEIQCIQDRIDIG
jgi:callose synthase